MWIRREISVFSNPILHPDVQFLAQTAMGKFQMLCVRRKQLKRHLIRILCVLQLDNKMKLANNVNEKVMTA